MRTSRLLMPAATLAGALALAGCGGSDNPVPMKVNGDKKITDAQCRANGGEGRQANKDGTACENIPGYKSAEMARKDATALYGNIVTQTPSTSMIPEGVKKDNQATKYFRGEGKALVGTPAPDGPNKGYRLLDETINHEVSSGEIQKVPNERTIAVGTYAGNYQGIPGMFRCTTAAGCTVQYAGDDKFDIGAGWHFKPTDPDAKTEGAKVAEWGWWVEDPDDASKDHVQLVYRSPNSTALPASDRAEVTGLAGEATYTGSALGRYAVVRSGTGSSSGDFEAKAELTAKFGDKAKLSGRIHDFNVGSGWEVMLEETDIDGSNAAFAGETMWKMGSAETITKGDWKAGMYGGSATAAPTHILGGFTAAHNEARMIGAFGTEEPKSDN